MSEETKTETTALAVSQPKSEAVQAFELIQRKAKAFADSDLVPDTYKGKQANCIVALEMANRVGASEMAVMQNLHIIHGRPSWSSQFVIGALNSCGKFSPIRFKFRDLGKKSVDATVTEYVNGQKNRKAIKVEIADRGCVAHAVDKATGEVLEGPEVTMEMAVKEGWYTKTDSKWKTMPEVMLRYRAAKFFGNFYAPDILMGMSTADEAEDMGAQAPRDITPEAPPIIQPRQEEPAAPQPASASDNAPAPEKRRGRPKTQESAPPPPPPIIESTATELPPETETPAPAPSLAKPTAPDAPAATPKVLF